MFREIQIKTTMRYHLTPIRMTIIQKPKNKCCEGYEEKTSLLHCWWKYKLVQAVRKSIWSFLKKIKTELPFDPAISLLGTYPKELNPNFKEISNFKCIPYLLTYSISTFCVFIWIIAKSLFIKLVLIYRPPSFSSRRNNKYNT